MQSIHRAPSEPLRDIIARLYLFGAELPPDYELVDNLLSETAFIRILLKGDWSAMDPDGSWRSAGAALLFGPNSRPMKVRCRGTFEVIGIALRPAGWFTLFDQPANEFTDRMLALDEVWGADSAKLMAALDATGGDIDGVVAAIERVLLERIESRTATKPDMQMLEFEQIARYDSTMKIADVCERLQLAPHTLERRCRATFGMAPKRVLRRSRFLDMASVMRGLFDPDEEVLAELRYADQSHLNHEFHEFIGMTPGQFVHTPTPLLTAGLELRNGHRYSNPSAVLKAFD